MTILTHFFTKTHVYVAGGDHIFARKEPDEIIANLTIQIARIKVLIH